MTENFDEVHAVEQIIRETLHRAGFRAITSETLAQVLADLERKQIPVAEFVALSTPELHELVHAMKWDKRYRTTHDPDEIAIALGMTPPSDVRRLLLISATSLVLTITVGWGYLAGWLPDALLWLIR